MNPTLIYVTGKRVGSVAGSVFYKTIRGSKHILRHPRPAIALDLESLNRIELMGVHTVKVTDSETHVIYTASVAHIRAVGFLVERGFGKQIALPLEGWVKSTKACELPKQIVLF